MNPQPQPCIIFIVNGLPNIYNFWNKVPYFSNAACKSIECNIEITFVF